MERPPSAWAVLAATLAMQAGASMAALAVPAMAPAFAASRGVSSSLAGVYIGTVYVGAMLASMASGPLVLRYGAIRASQAALLACAAGLAIQLAWPTTGGAMLGALLLGLGYGPITPASSHVLARTVPAQRAGLVFSVKQTGVPLGGVLAGAVVPPLVLAGGVSAALACVAAVAIVCAALAQPLRAALDADRQPGQPLRLNGFVASLGLMSRHPALARLAASSFVFSVVQMSLSTYLVTYLHTALGYSLVQAGMAMSVAQMGGVGGRVLWGYVADRWFGAPPVLAALAALMALCALGTAGLGAWVPLPVALALLATFGASAIGWNGVYLAEVARRAPPGMAGAATGGTLAVTFLGVVIGPTLFGLISQATGSYRVGFLSLAVPVGLCATWLWSQVRRSAPA